MLIPFYFGIITNYMERENRLGRFVERKRLNFVARSVATMSLAAGGIVAVEKTGVFDPLASSVDSANHLVLKTPHKAYEQLIEMLPGAENAEAQTPNPDQYLGNQNQGGPDGPQRVITINDRFSDIAKAEPAFGGMFYDKQGNLNVALLDTGKKESAQAAIAAVFGNKRIPKDGIRVVPARYGFADLRTWHDQATSLFGIPGVLSSGIDHATNTLEISVQDMRLEDEIRRQLQSLGIPAAAVRIEQREPIILLTLRQNERPVEGGLEIRREIDATHAAQCTLGYNARRAGVEGFVTASHCSTTRSVVDADFFYQIDTNNEDDEIGHETVDPPWFSYSFDHRCTNNPVTTKCRWSDVNFSKYHIGVNFRRGFIEKTASGANPNPIDVNIAGSFQITGTKDVVKGETVNKVGRSTGWTQGNVTKVCEDEVLPDNIIILCQTEANYNVAEGDSGSPVFQIPSSGSDNVTLVGSLWGGYGSDGQTDEGRTILTTGMFSPFSLVVAELGTLTVTMPVGVGGVAELPDLSNSPQNMTSEKNKDKTIPIAAGVAGSVTVFITAAGAVLYIRRKRSA